MNRGKYTYSFYIYAWFAKKQNSLKVGITVSRLQAVLCFRPEYPGGKLLNAC